MAEGSDVRRQETGVRSQESGVGSRESGVAEWDVDFAMYRSFGSLLCNEEFDWKGVSLPGIPI
jgi:hypothetical protein